MSMRVSVRPVNGGIAVFERVQLENLKQGQRALCDAILIEGRKLAPKDKGDLRHSGTVEMTDRSMSVVFGSGRVPYARIHELGGMTGRNHASRIPAQHYLSRAGDSVTRGGIERWLRR